MPCNGSPTTSAAESSAADSSSLMMSSTLLPLAPFSLVATTPPLFATTPPPSATAPPLQQLPPLSPALKNILPIRLPTATRLALPTSRIQRRETAIMIDPAQVIEAFQTKSLLLPTSSSTPDVSPIPTVRPDVPVYETVGETGTKTLWVVFVMMFLSSLAFYYLAFRVPVQKRLFHILTALITTFATLSYFAMATGDGHSYAHIIVKETHKHTPDTVQHIFRQVFWARYIDWAVTTPLLLLDLAFLAGLNGANILVTIVADILMVLLGLFAAFGSTDGQKWGYYAMACVAYLVIVYQLVVPGRRAVAAKDGKTAKLFAAIGGFTLILWTLYPVVWGIGDGARKWSVDAEIVAYAVLDVLAKPVFGFWLLSAHAKSASAVDGFWAHGLASEGSLRVGEDDD
ncbi:hypothetical protein PZA11_005472 [Diplocarpon coronariae]